MTQPNDPTEALPTHRLPVDGAATARLDDLPHPAEPTMDLAAAEPTARPRAGGSPTHPGPAEPTVHPHSGEATAYLGSREPTADLRGEEATAYLGSREPTADLRGEEATAYLGSREPTAHLSADEATAYLGSGEPTAALTAGGPAAPPHPGEPTVRLDIGRVGAFTTGQAGQAQAAATPTATGQVTGNASGTLFGGRTGASPAPPGGEVRFGPGVPSTPPAAPAWPARTPPRRRRSALRTVTSALSTVLTVALLAAVGLHIWQRLSPLEVTGVAVAVPRPAGDRCDVTVDVVATVSTNGRAGKIRYQWLRTGSAPGSLLTERVGRGQRSVHLTLRWAFTGVGTTTGTATVNIVSPSAVQAQAPVTYDCRRG